jgi:hypothetical protein
MKGYLKVYKSTGDGAGEMRQVLASAQWQNLNHTMLGNPRKRKPDWIVLFSMSNLTGGSINNRMTREQAEGLVSVLTKVLATKPEDPTEFVEFEPAEVKPLPKCHRCGYAIRDVESMQTPHGPVHVNACPVPRAHK